MRGALGPPVEQEPNCSKHSARLLDHSVGACKVDRTHSIRPYISFLTVFIYGAMLWTSPARLTSVTPYALATLPTCCP